MQEKKQGNSDERILNENCKKYLSLLQYNVTTSILTMVKWININTHISHILNITP